MDGSQLLQSRGGGGSRGGSRGGYMRGSQWDLGRSNYQWDLGQSNQLLEGQMRLPGLACLQTSSSPGLEENKWPALAADQ